MRVEVSLHPGGQQKAVELADAANGLDLLRALALAPDVHILVRGDLPIPEDAGLQDGDRIRVVAVVSGG